MCFLEHHPRIEKVNQLCTIMPQYPCCTRFNKPSRQVMQWSAKVINLPRGMIVLVFTVTLSNPSASQRNLITAALLSVQKSVYYHLMAQYQYHTEAMIEYMGNYLEEFPLHKDIFSSFCARKSTKKVKEALKCGVLWTNRRNRRVTTLGKIFLLLQRVTTLMKI